MTAAIHALPAGRARSACRPTRLRLSLLVDPRDVLRVRRAIVVLAHPSVAILTLKCVRGDSRVLLTIGLDPDIAGELMDRLVKAVNAGAFGTPVSAPARSSGQIAQVTSSPAGPLPSTNIS